MTDTKKWPYLLEAYYGTELSAPQALIWFEELSLINPKPNNEDICNAIRHAQKSGKKVRYKANLIDIGEWVKDYRAFERTETGSEDRQAAINGIVSLLERKRLSGASRYDIIDSMAAERGARRWITQKDENYILGRVINGINGAD